MGRFEFRSRDVELDFGGLKTTVPGSMEYAQKLERVAKEMVEWGNNPENEKDTEGAKKFMLGVLDELLGEAFMDKVEAERELDIYDCTDMFAYINTEVTAYHVARVAPHMQSVPDRRR